MKQKTKENGKIDIEVLYRAMEILCGIPFNLSQVIMEFPKAIFKVVQKYVKRRQKKCSK